MVSRSIVFLLYLFLLVYSSQGNADLTPKFFNNERQKCNCFNNAKCSAKGRCPDEVCAKTFVGVSCQHAAIQTIVAPNYLTNIPTKLTDGDPTTCGNSLNLVNFSSNTKLYYFWIYVSRSKPLSMAPLLLRNKNDSIDTDTYEWITISQTSVLIRPKAKESPWHVSSLSLLELPKDACTVEIGIGRNLAFMGNPTNSHNDSIKVVYNPHTSIDGYDGISVERGHCPLPQIDHRNDRVWWSINFKFNAHVNFITLLSSSDTACQSMAFQVLPFTEFGRPLTATVYNKGSTTRLNKYFYVVADIIKKVQVHLEASKLQKIINQNASCQHSAWLPVCEVEIFGEFLCPQDTFGAFCDPAWPACTNENWVPDWGCLKGCSNGGRGPWCKKDPPVPETKSSYLIFIILIICLLVFLTLICCCACISARRRRKKIGEGSYVKATSDVDLENAENQDSTAKPDDGTLDQIEGNIQDQNQDPMKPTDKSGAADSQKNQEPTPQKNQDPTPQKKQDPTPHKKQDPTPQKEQDTTTQEKQDPTAQKKQDPTTQEKQDPTAQKDEDPTPQKSKKKKRVSASPEDPDKVIKKKGKSIFDDTVKAQDDDL